MNEEEEWHSEKINVTLFICGEETLMVVSWRKCVDYRDLHIYYIQTVDKNFPIQKNYRVILDRMYDWKEGIWNTRSTIRFPTDSTIRSRSIKIDCFCYTWWFIWMNMLCVCHLKMHQIIFSENHYYSSMMILLYMEMILNTSVYWKFGQSIWNLNDYDWKSQNSNWAFKWDIVN